MFIYTGVLAMLEREGVMIDYLFMRSHDSPRNNYPLKSRSLGRAWYEFREVMINLRPPKRGGFHSDHDKGLPPPFPISSW